MATDDFNRSNADTLGSPWLVTTAGDYGIRSNQAAPLNGTGRVNCWRRDVTSGNANVKVTLKTTGAGNARVIFRANAAGTSYMEAVFAAAGAYTLINQYSGGTETQVGDFYFPGTAFQADDILEVNCDGSDLQLWRTRSGTRTRVNAATTSSFNSTEYGYGFGVVNDTNARFDDFEVTAIGGSTPLSAGTASFVSSGPGGISVSATAPADGTGAGPTYQWERNSDGGSYSDVSGATSLTLTDSTATTAGVLYRYRCKQTRGSETVTTNAVAAQFYSGGAISSGAGGVSRGRLVNAGGV
jgi:hypothetical protein